MDTVYKHVGFNWNDQRNVAEQVRTGALVLVLRTARHSLLKVQPKPGSYYRKTRKQFR